MKKFFIVLFVLVFTGWLAMIGGAMFKNKVLASEVEGQLVADADGTPVPGVTVIRRWKWAWTETEGEDRMTTDSSGKFRFPEVTGQSLLGVILPHQPSVDQDFTVEYDHNKPPFLILGLQKSNYDRNGETQGRPMRLQCRTDLKPDAYGFYWGTCRLL